MAQRKAFRTIAGYLFRSIKIWIGDSTVLWGSAGSPFNRPATTQGLGCPIFLLVVESGSKGLEKSVGESQSWMPAADTRRAPLETAT